MNVRGIVHNQPDAQAQSWVLAWTRLPRVIDTIARCPLQVTSHVTSAMPKGHLPHRRPDRVEQQACGTSVIPPVGLQNGRELQNALKEKVPSKIDIGPVYTQDPAKRAAYKGDTSASGFKPVERELVFDIDLTDYDDVRNSSTGTGMSRKCWSLMHIAIVVRSSGQHFTDVSSACWVWPDRNE